MKINLLKCLAMLTKQWVMSLFILSLLPSVHGCVQPSPRKDLPAWESAFDRQLPLLGHRNWILIVDKAFPAQTASGVEVINTESDMVTVVRAVLAKLAASDHVTPVVYTDREFDFLTADLVPQITAVREAYTTLFEGFTLQSMLHESVFGRIDEASKMFKTVVLKTECLIPYSSVFIELDCKYWNEKSEQTLREKMNK